MHPMDLVAPVADDILQMAGEVESERCLPAPLMSRLVDAGLFSIYTPRAFGGLELALPSALRIVEAVARLDGSTGWTVALGFANDRITSALPDESAARVFSNGSALIAGAPGFAVRAAAVEGGYRVTGQWPFCSGAPNADWMTVIAPIFDGQAPRMGPGGPEMVVAFMPPSDVEIVDTWCATGLRGTGSHDLRANDVFVPTTMTGAFVMPAGPTPVRESVLSRIPFFTMLNVVQSPPVCLGVAQHAIDLFPSFASQKQRAFGPKLCEQVQVQAGLARATALVNGARAYWYETVEHLWDKVAEGDQLALDDRIGAHLASVTVAENCVAAVDYLYRQAGTSGVFESSLIGRCWRDVRTAAQHVQVQDGWWETAGRALLGLDPANPLL